MKGIPLLIPNRIPEQKKSLEFIPSPHNSSVRFPPPIIPLVKPRYNPFVDPTDSPSFDNLILRHERFLNSLFSSKIRALSKLDKDTPEYFQKSERYLFLINREYDIIKRCNELKLEYNFLNSLKMPFISI